MKESTSTFRYKLKIALTVFLPLAFIMNSVLWMFYYQESTTKYNSIETHAVNTINMQSLKIGSNFKLIASDLIFFSSYNQLMDMLDDSEVHKSRLTKDLALFSRGSKIYDQIRILDVAGMEIVRINYSGDLPVVTPENQLQFKGGRYYFRDTIPLAKGEIFLSPFDLNIEHGKVEQPLKPMIRFGTPIFDRKGDKRGIAIFNYLGANLIQDIKGVVSNLIGFSMLLNSSGYWIIGRDATDEWGFMYDDKKDRTMRNVYPDAWKKISASDTGQFYTAKGLFTFITVYPSLENRKSSAGSGKAFATNAKKDNARGYYWKIVSLIPEDYFSEEIYRILRKYLYLSAMLIALLGFGSWFWASVKSKQNTARYELAELTDRLRKSNIKLKELDRLKSMFVASMSHELRTPLNSIIGFTGVILQGMSGDLNERQKDQLGRVNGASHHLLDLINDVIDISKIEAERTDVFPVDLVMDEVIEEAIGAVQIQLEAKGLDLTVDVPKGLNLMTDRKRLLQCILNLLSNAVKYTDEGEIRITARSIGSEVEVAVTDSGIGIPEPALEKLFQPFERLQSHVSVKAGGTGLGLYLTKKIATELLGGGVAVESQVEEGSTFRLKVAKTLPGNSR